MVKKGPAARIRSCSMVYNSLLAAFTMDEVRAQVAAAGLALTVGPIGVRHMLIKASTLRSTTRPINHEGHEAHESDRASRSRSS